MWTQTKICDLNFTLESETSLSILFSTFNSLNQNDIFHTVLKWVVWVDYLQTFCQQVSLFRVKKDERMLGLSVGRGHRHLSVHWPGTYWLKSTRHSRWLSPRPIFDTNPYLYQMRFRLKWKVQWRNIRQFC